MLTATWRKATYSNPSGNCAEVRLCGGTVQVRDSRAGVSPVLSFTRAEWAAFLGTVTPGGGYHADHGAEMDSG